MKRTVRFHVYMGKRRTMTSLDAVVAEYLAIKLCGHAEGKKAKQALKEWIQTKVDDHGDPNRALLTHWLHKQALQEIIDKDLLDQYHQ